MLHLKADPDYRARWSIAEKHFCEKPSFKDNTPLRIRDPDGLKELSLVFFTGWLFSGILNRDKELVRPSLLPVGKAGESSLLVLYHPNTPLATPARRELGLLDADFFTCPLDKANKPLTLTEMRLCPVVNKLRYNLAHAKPSWDVSGLTEPSKTQDCCNSAKNLLWQYLDRTVCSDPDLYGPMVGGAAFPVRLPFALLYQYLTGVQPRTRDFGSLLEETLLWYAMAKSGVLIGEPHITLTEPFESNEIDLLLYESAGKTKAIKEEPTGGWASYLADQSICMIELTIGHHSEGEAASEHRAKKSEAKEFVEQETKKQSGKDVPKNKLVNFLALKTAGFRLVHANYVSVVGDPNIAAATRQALTSTDGFHYVFLPDIVKEDIEATVLNHHDSRVPVAKVRSWHEALISVIESMSADFAVNLAK
jgi:hypothetical protein